MAKEQVAKEQVDKELGKQVAKEQNDMFAANDEKLRKVVNG